MKNQINKTANRLNTYRIIKLIQLVIIIILEIVYLSILICNKTLRAAVLTNSYLLILCTLTWIILIVTFVCMLVDISLLRSQSDIEADEAVELIDSLSGLPNRASVEMMIDNHSTPESMKNLSCAILRLPNLVIVNKTQSYNSGDTLIRDFCSILKDVGSNYGFIGRNSGNEYLGIFEGCNDDTITQFIADLNVAINLYNSSHSDTPIEIDYSYALNSKENTSSLTDLLNIAYKSFEE